MGSSKRGRRDHNSGSDSDSEDDFELADEKLMVGWYIYIYLNFEFHYLSSVLWVVFSLLIAQVERGDSGDDFENSDASNDDDEEVRDEYDDDDGMEEGEEEDSDDGEGGGGMEDEMEKLEMEYMDLQNQEQ